MESSHLLSGLSLLGQESSHGHIGGADLLVRGDRTLGLDVLETGQLVRIYLLLHLHPVV